MSTEHQVLISNALKNHVAVAQLLGDQLTDDIGRAAGALIDCLKSGHKILLCGNGGSAADAQHIAAELTGRFLRTDRKPLPAIALTTDTSALTAIGNDFGFASVFSRQVDALAQSGDTLVGISTSGNSENIIEAFDSARSRLVKTIVLSGGSGGQLAALADLKIIVPSTETPRIQEMHILIGHILCDLIDREFAGRAVD